MIGSKRINVVGVGPHASCPSCIFVFNVNCARCLADRVYRAFRESQVLEIGTSKEGSLM